MPWDGNGTFDRVHNFSADASAGIQAQAVRFDAEFDGIKTGLENCVTLTGETTPTANTPMGGFKHTGVAAATSTDNYLRADQHSNQVGIYVRDTNTGVTGVMSCSAAVFPTAFTDGQRVTVKVSADGSAAATRVIKINGLSANVVDNEGSAVPASKMLKDGIFDLVYDASAAAFRSLTPGNDVLFDSGSFDSGSFTATLVGTTTSPTETVYWYKNGNLITLTLPATLVGLSNSTGLSFTGLPTALRPSGTLMKYPCVALRDAGSQHLAGQASFSDSTSVVFSLTDGGAFTNDNLNKGLDSGWAVTYCLVTN